MTVDAGVLSAGCGLVTGKVQTRGHGAADGGTLRVGGARERTDTRRAIVASGS